MFVFPFPSSAFLILSLLVFFLFFILPSYLSLFISYFYRCVSLLLFRPSSSCAMSSIALALFPVLFSLLIFLFPSTSISVFITLFSSFSFSIYFSVFLSLFVYTTIYLLLLSFVASSYASLFFLPSLVSSSSPNKFIRNKL